MTRSFPEWEERVTPERASTSSTFRFTTGSSVTLERYAVEVNRPRKRSSPSGSPAALKVFTPM